MIRISLPNKKIITYINNVRIKTEGAHELLGITIDSKHKFQSHINKLCKKTRQKSNTLARISNYMVFDRRKIMKAFITPQFCYYHLVLMFHSKQLGKNRCIR